MTLTDEEARKVLAIIRSHGRCWACDASGKMIPWAPGTQRDEPVKCPYCDGKGNRHKEIITLLESRIGQPDLSARVRELEGALRPVLDQRNIVVNGSMVVTLCLTRDEYNRAARALKGEG